MVLLRNTGSRIENNIASDLFWTRCRFSNPTTPFIINHVDVRLDSLIINLGKFDLCKIDRFWYISKEYM